MTFKQIADILCQMNFFDTFDDFLFLFQCIVIEDALAGVQAAKAAHMRYIIFANSNFFIKKQHAS